jgi:hypothetical protein
LEKAENERNELEATKSKHEKVAEGLRQELASLKKDSEKQLLADTFKT